MSLTGLLANKVYLLCGLESIMLTGYHYLWPSWLSEEGFITSLQTGSTPLPCLGVLTPERRCLPSTYILALSMVCICVRRIIRMKQNE